MSGSMPFFVPRVQVAKTASRDGYEEPELTPEEASEFASLQSLMTNEYLTTLAKKHKPQKSWYDDNCVYPF